MLVLFLVKSVHHREMRCALCDALVVTLYHSTERHRFNSKLTIQNFLSDRGFEPRTLSCNINCLIHKATLGWRAWIKYCLAKHYTWSNSRFLITKTNEKATWSVLGAEIGSRHQNQNDYNLDYNLKLKSITIMII